MSEPPKKDDMDDFWNSLDREDLACLGLRRVKHPFQDDDFFSDLTKQAEEEYFANLKPDKATKNRKPNVIQQARTAGIDVARIEMRPDGTVVIITGKPAPVAPENPWPLDEFRTKETGTGRADLRHPALRLASP